jgi:hypothetical protein
MMCLALLASDARVLDEGHLIMQLPDPKNAAVRDVFIRSVPDDGAPPQCQFILVMAFVLVAVAAGVAVWVALHWPLDAAR